MGQSSVGKLWGKAQDRVMAKRPPGAIRAKIQELEGECGWVLKVVRPLFTEPFLSAALKAENVFLFLW
jgi:hypothetical protein